MTATPATRALDAAGVRYELTQYDAPGDGDFGASVVEALGLDPGATGKSLVALVDDDLVVAVVPVDRRLDLKALARAASAKRARMAEVAEAERVTGSVVGGIAPLGHRRPLVVYLDADLCDHDRISVSGGRRGLELHLAAADLASVTRATVAPLTTSAD